jgi:hypothetical protein
MESFHSQEWAGLTAGMVALGVSIYLRRPTATPAAATCVATNPASRSKPRYNIVAPDLASLLIA